MKQVLLVAYYYPPIASGGTERAVKMATYLRRFGHKVCVLTQTYQPYEIIVVNDGSPHNVQQVVEPYMESLRYIEQSNQGLAAARNTGIRHSQGKYSQKLS